MLAASRGVWLRKFTARLRDDSLVTNIYLASASLDSRAGCATMSALWKKFVLV
jgi:hypothetical protein